MPECIPSPPRRRVMDHSRDRGTHIRSLETYSVRNLFRNENALTNVHSYIFRVLKESFMTIFPLHISKFLIQLV